MTNTRPAVEHGIIDPAATGTWRCFTCGRAFPTLVRLDAHVERKSCQRNR